MDQVRSNNAMSPASSRPVRQRSPSQIRAGAAALTVLVGLASACHPVVYKPEPLQPAATAAAFDRRSLDAPELRTFLARNLGHESPSGPAGAWDFETLAWVAFYYHPGLAEARAQWVTTQAAARTAGARPNPTLSLTPGYSTNAGANSPWFPAVGLDWPLETAGKRHHRIEAAQANTEAARQNLFAAVWRVRRDLRTALLDFSLAREQSELWREQAVIAGRIVERLRQRAQAGAIAAPEVASAELAAVRAEAAAADAERRVIVARQAIAVALGLPASAVADLHATATVEKGVPAADQLTAARAVSLRSRPDVLTELARYRAAEADLALEVARQYPDLRLGPGYQWDQGQNKWSLGFTLELPVLNQNQGPIAEAEARRREAAARFVAVQSAATAEIDGAIAARSAAVAQRARLTSMQARLQRQQQRAEGRLQAGAGDPIEVESARLEVAAGAVNLAEATHAVEVAAGQLEDALQIPFANLSRIESEPPATASSQ